MAKTEYPVNHPNVRKVWSADVAKEALKKTYAMRFMGTSANSVIQVRQGLKNKGDTEHFFLRMQLGGGGVQGDGTLEGNEEQLAIYRDSVVINQLRHAVRSGGKMSEQRVPYEIRQQCRDGLADWWADRIDTWFLNQVGGAAYETDTRYTGNQSAAAPTATTNAFLYAGTSTASSTGTAEFGLTAIDKCVELAQTNPTPIRPVRVNNGEFYVLFISPTQFTALKTAVSTSSITWYDVQRALVEAKGDLKSPIFTGAAGIYNQTIIHVSTRVPGASAATLASGETRRAVFCGAQAAVMAFGRGYSEGTPYDWEEETFDYGNQLGVAAGCIGGLKKTQFDHNADGTQEDFATITVTSPAAPITTA